ncbi:MAG: CDP-glucose 4,6-dehydratase [Lentisphaeria bacterium]|nr:CDP-glucose 4,6-dehydratase [Lentisphaeria bacterium]
MFGDIYRGRKVLITGHTGFKGSWLAFWLKELGAELCGVALPMETEHVHFDLLGLDMRSETADIRDRGKIAEIVADFRPEAVFHLAARPLVRRSYREPVETFSVNVMGTIHVLDACRLTDSVRAVVAVTSDKCYENTGKREGYKESDPMGGFDPYSASKGCAELAVASYRRSFFDPDEYGKKHRLLLASARAGNVIGGGDWAEDRLVPDMMKAAAAGETVTIRNPRATRPWQHVLEPLSGYLVLGARLLAGETRFARGWNFGPAAGENISVEQVASALAKEWDRVRYRIDPPADAPHEAALLALNCTLARKELLWHGVWTPEETFARTAAWYRDFHTANRVRTAEDFDAYISDARQRGLAWTK